MEDQRLRELEEKYEGYTVYDNAGEKIGKVDDLFVDESDREEYLGVRMGLFGLSGTTLIPMEIVRVNDRERAIEVAESKDHVKDAPKYDDDDEVTDRFEDRIRGHFGLESDEPSAERGSYGRYSGAAAGGDDTRRDDRTDDARHTGRPLGGAQDREEHEREREPLGEESYRNREDVGSERAMGTAGAGEATPAGSPRDLETGDRGREEHQDRGDLESPGRETTRGDEGARDRTLDEGYREGYREGLREGFREGLREGGEHGETGDRGDPGTVTGSGRTEERMPRHGGGEPGAESTERSGGPTARSGDEPRETQSRSSGEREESGLTRVWKRVRS